MKKCNATKLEEFHYISRLYLFTGGRASDASEIKFSAS